MNKNTFLPISIILGAIVIAIGIYTGLSSQASDSASANVYKADDQKEEEILDPLLEISDEDHVFGNPNASISLIEYSDFECPFCRSFHPTPELLVDEFGSDVNWIYRHYPLSFHDPAATLEANAAECAAEQSNDAFWAYSKKIFETTAGNGSGIEKDNLVTMADELSLDAGAFKDCLDAKKYNDRIKQDFKNGTKLGVSGTPATFVVNRKTGESTFVSGAQSFAKMKILIEGML